VFPLEGQLVKNMYEKMMAVSCKVSYETLQYTVWRLCEIFGFKSGGTCYK